MTLKNEILLDETDLLVQKALFCLEMKLSYAVNQILNNTSDVCAYTRLQLAQEESEVFAALFLDNHNQLITFEKLFYGTINESAVYPRKLVQKSLQHNAAKIIIAHNHPSGNCKPSESDLELTLTLKNILKVVDVQLIDHVVVSLKGTSSFAELGLL